ncbi:MAG: diguanylate cyclase [Spirochaetaceae bacterium]
MIMEFKNINILIVEDSLTQSVQLQFMLEGRGYQVSSAQNGQEGFEQAQHRKPSIIISDITMPVMDGWELCQKIKSTDNLKDIPVILLTDLSHPNDIIKGLKSGADSFLIKPPQVDTLFSRIDFILANQELRGGQMGTMSLDLYFSGDIYHITPERIQIVNLLFTTFENTIKENIYLQKAKQDLHTVQNTLIQLKEELKALALQDELTSLNNLRGFKSLSEHQLKMCRYKKENIMLFSLDVDKLKQINDSFGHSMGNSALKDSVTILHKTFRNTDIFARIEDSKFVVLSIAEPTETVDIYINRIKENIKEFNSMEKRQYTLSISVGTVFCSYDKFLSIEELIELADQELLRDKQGTRNGQEV